MNQEGDVPAHNIWQERYVLTVTEFAVALLELQKTNPWPSLPVLPMAINFLATELWDKGLSQTEIRNALEGASSDLPRYTAGENIRT